MKRIIAIFLLIILSVSLVSGCIGGGDDDDTDVNTTTPATTTTKPPTTTASPTQGDTWDLYGFEVGDSFTYDVEWDSQDFNMDGEFSMEFLSCATHDYQVHYWGNYSGTMSGNFNATFKTDQEGFYENFLQSISSTNAFISPLFMFTIVAPWWNMYFSESNISLGSHWSMTVDGNTSTFSFDSPCSHAGISGYLGRWTFSGSGYSSEMEACVSADFPLATYTEYTFQQSSETITYTSELVEWS
ncbi:MAG TPA: hypothetical protein PK718_08630 [Candidatus Methanofastidiosa archaeon]|nr:hypothetical protein [Candidatus Methanofastidiosa archaeon]